MTGRLSQSHGWNLTVLRPGYIWGRGGEWVYGLGIRAGPALAVVAPRSRLPLTHVRNCADCFATVIEEKRSFGETYNVVDGYRLSTWEYAGRYQHWAGRNGVRFPFPYRGGWPPPRWYPPPSAPSPAVRRPPRLPSLFVPASFEARFKPLRHGNTKLAEQLGWHPPHELSECLADTFGTAAGHEPI